MPCFESIWSLFVTTYRGRRQEAGLSPLKRSSPMKIALIGGSGRVGQAILAEAVQRGHDVTVIARNPEKLDATAGHVKSGKADVANADETARAVKGHDAIISAFNS